MDQKQKVVLVTGRSGFVGSQLVAALPETYQVICLDPHENGERIDSVFERIEKRYGTKIASVVHLAEFKNGSAEQDMRYHEINVMGTERLLSALSNFQVGQFIFASSMFVHAPCQLGDAIDEASAVEPKWSYPDSKLRAERLVRSYAAQMPVVVLRTAEIYDDYCHSATLSSQIQSIFEQRLNSVIYPGDISRGKSFLHVEDLTAAILNLINSSSRLERETTLLLGEPNSFSYDYLQRVLGRLIHHQEWRTYQIPRELALSELWLKEKLPLLDESFMKSWMVLLADDHYALNISKAQQLLEWQPQHSLDHTLAKMIDAFKTDPVEWYREHKLELPSWMEVETIPRYRRMSFQEAV